MTICQLVLRKMMNSLAYRGETRIYDGASW